MALIRRNGPPSPPRGLTIDIVSRTEGFTLSANDIEAIHQVNSGSDVTVTAPNDLPVGFYAYFEQAGAGKVIISPASGATLVNRADYDRTAGQYALICVYVRANTNGVSAEYLLTGDAAAS